MKLRLRFEISGREGSYWLARMVQGSSTPRVGELIRVVEPFRQTRVDSIEWVIERGVLVPEVTLVGFQEGDDYSSGDEDDMRTIIRRAVRDGWKAQSFGPDGVELDIESETDTEDKLAAEPEPEIHDRGDEHAEDEVGPVEGHP